MKTKTLVTAAALMFGSLAFASAEDTPVAKTWDLLPVESVPVPFALPDQSPARWGKWVFGEERPWFSYMLQPEAVGDRFEPPSIGFDTAGWQKFHAAWLRARKYVPVEWRGRRVFFSLSGIRCPKARLFVNGREIADIANRTCRIDVASALEFGDRNEFLLLLDGGNRSHFMLESGPPMLEPRDPDSVDDVFVHTSWREKRLTIGIQVSAEKPKTIGVVAKVLDGNGKEVKVIRETYDVPGGTSVVSPSVKWTDPIPWELGRGYLYTLKTVVLVGSKERACPDVRFGFREFWRKGRTVYLNGHVQNLRVTRDFGCNAFGAKMLAKLGFNVIDFRRDKEAEMLLDDGLLEYLSENGIGVIAPVAVFDRNSAGGMTKSDSWREDVRNASARVIRRYRNWPCFVMHGFGVDAYAPKHPGDPAFFGAEDAEPFPKTVNEYAEAGRAVNSNVLYSSDSEGALGDMEAVSLAYDGAETAEWEDRLSGWAANGRLPLRVRELKLPGWNGWYRDGRDCVTEILAAWYGDRAYELEPDSIRVCHRSNAVDCVRHPLVGAFARDFVTRVNRAWRTFGANGGIAWADPATGYGMPPPPAADAKEKPKAPKGKAEPPKVAYDFLKTEKDVPAAKPAWANPAWDLVKSLNTGFLGWIAGCPRVTDRRHAYEAGRTVEKQCVMMWDGSRSRKLSVQWKVVGKKKSVASGHVEKTLEPGKPVFVPVSFKAPAVKAKTRFTLNASFLDEKGKQIGTDSFVFDVQPEVFGPPPYNTLCTARTRVVEAFSLKSAADLPWEEIRNGLKVLVLQQSAEVMKSFGFEVDDAAPRRLFLRDRVSPAFAKLDEDDLREWYGQPRTEQTALFGAETYGHIVKAKGRAPRWNYNNALCGLLLRTPDAVGYLPVIEGGFDGDWSAVVRRFVGKGEIVFSTLSTIDRFGLNELEGAPVRDPSARKTQVAVCDDLLLPPGPAHARKIYPAGDYALRMAKDYGTVFDRNGIVPNGVVLCGPDSDIDANELVSAARRGSNVLVIDNRRLAEGLGLKVAAPSDGVYGVKADPTNPDLRSVGANVLHFRAPVVYSSLTGGGKDWKLDAEGMFASRTYREGGVIFVSQLDPYRLGDGVMAETHYLDAHGKKQPLNDKLRRENLGKVDLTVRHHRQFTARLLTLLGVGSGDGPLYSDKSK